MQDVEKASLSTREPGQACQKTPGRCLVLAPRDFAVCGALLSALSKRGLAVHLVRDEPAVMVELAGGDCAVVVAVDPPAWPRLGELAYAVRQHFPAVHCWQFTENHQGPHLSGLHRDYLGPRPPRSANDTLTGAATTNENATAQLAHQGIDHDTEHAIEHDGDFEHDGATPSGGFIGPIGRIRGRRKHINTLVVRAPYAPSPSGSLISEEELTMLLGPTPGEAS